MVEAIQEGLEERKVEKVDTEASEVPVAKKRNHVSTNAHALIKRMKKR